MATQKRIKKADFVMAGSIENYKDHFSVDACEPTPMKQLGKWMNEWVDRYETTNDKQPKFAGTMGTLITYDKKTGYPRSRLMGIDGIEREGILLQSRPDFPKMLQLRDHAKAAFHLQFLWPDKVQAVELLGNLEIWGEGVQLPHPLVKEEVFSWQRYLFKVEGAKFAQGKFYEESTKRFWGALNYVQYERQKDKWLKHAMEPFFAKSLVGAAAGEY